MIQRETPEINAGSMADIAFLLLIFFLVTTTLHTEIGIFKRLPDKKQTTSLPVNERNVLEVSINSNDEILIENSQLVQLEDVKKYVASFIDNGGGTDKDGNKCTWCNGEKDILSSEHPSKAIIKLQSNRSTTYATYIAVQNEIIAAYNELRNTLALNLYNTSYTNLLAALKNDKKNKALQSKIKFVKSKYPQLIIEEAPIK